jgi:hypothetical protein
LRACLPITLLPLPRASVHIVHLGLFLGLFLR